MAKGVFAFFATCRLNTFLGGFMLGCFQIHAVEFTQKPIHGATHDIRVKIALSFSLKFECMQAVTTGCNA